MWIVYDNNDDSDDVDYNDNYNDDWQRTNCDHKNSFEPSAQVFSIISGYDLVITSKRLNNLIFFNINSSLIRIE